MNILRFMFVIRSGSSLYPGFVKERFDCIVLGILIMYVACIIYS